MAVSCLSPSLVIYADYVVNDDPVEAYDVGEISDLLFECRELGNGDERYIEITGYKGESDSVTVPESICDIPVKRIGNFAFQESGITSIQLPDNLKEIGEFAFLGCKGLEDVTIPKNVEEIETGAFCCTGLKSVTFLCLDCRIDDCFDYDTTVMQTYGMILYNDEEYENFYYNHLTFSDTFLSKEEANYIGEQILVLDGYLSPDCVFYGYPTSNVRDYAEDYGCTYENILNEGEPFQYENCGDHVEITAYAGSSEHVTIPHDINGLPVTAIADKAFYNMDFIESIDIQAELTTIGQFAFAGCSSLACF